MFVPLVCSPNWTSLMVILYSNIFHLAEFTYEPADYELDVIDGLSSKGSVLQRIATQDDNSVKISIEKENMNFKSNNGLYIR